MRLIGVWALSGRMATPGWRGLSIRRGRSAIPSSAATSAGSGSGAVSIGSDGLLGWRCGRRRPVDAHRPSACGSRLGRHETPLQRGRRADQVVWASPDVTTGRDPAWKTNCFVELTT